MTNEDRRGQRGSSPLSRRLREWDPATDQSLDPGEVDLIRLRLQAESDRLSSASTRPRLRSGLWSPRLVAVAAGLLALVVAGSIWLAGRQRDSRSEDVRVVERLEDVSGRVADRESPATAAEAVAPLPTSEERSAADSSVESSAEPAVVAAGLDLHSLERTTGSGTADGSRQPVAAIAETAPPEIRLAVSQIDTQVDPQAEAQPRRARRLAFQAPGGTRIYWTLDPGFSDSGSLAEATLD